MYFHIDKPLFTLITLAESSSTEASTQSELTVEDSALPPASGALTDVPNKQTPLSTASSTEDDDPIVERPAQPAVQPSPPPSGPESGTVPKEPMTMTAEGSPSAPPSRSERTSPLPDGNPSHSRPSVKPTQPPQIIAAPIEGAHKNKNQPRVVEKDNRNQRPLEKSLISKVGSSLTETTGTVKKKKPNQRQRKKKKEELQAQRQANSVQKEEDDVKATLPPSAMISPNATQSSALQQSPKNEEKPEAVGPKEEPFTPPKLPKSLKVSGLV